MCIKHFMNALYANRIFYFMIFFLLLNKYIYIWFSFSDIKGKRKNNYKNITSIFKPKVWILSFMTCGTKPTEINKDHTLF